MGDPSILAASLKIRQSEIQDERSPKWIRPAEHWLHLTTSGGGTRRPFGRKSDFTQSCLASPGGVVLSATPEEPSPLIS